MSDKTKEQIYEEFVYEPAKALIEVCEKHGLALAMHIDIRGEGPDYDLFVTTLLPDSSGAIPKVWTTDPIAAHVHPAAKHGNGPKDGTIGEEYLHFS